MTMTKTFVSVCLALSLAAPAFAGPVVSTSKVAHDYNNDKNSDVMYQDGSGLLFELLLDGTAILPASTSLFTLPAGWTVVDDGDFNNDNFVDILLDQGGGSRNLFELLIQGTTIQAGSTTVFQMPVGWSVVGVGDFNGDGFEDLLLTEGTIIFALLIQGTTILPASTTIFDLPANWVVRGTGKFNDDEFTDILLEDTVGGFLFGLHISGTTVLPTSGTIVGLSTGDTVVGVGDVDKLNQSDIILKDSADMLSAVLLNGNVPLTTSGSIFDSSAFNTITVGDYNKDDYTDVLLENDAGLLFELLLQGTSILPASTAVWTKPAGWVIVGG